MACRVLVTGFEPFAGLPRNPSADVARRIGRDAECREAGARAAVLPVSRAAAPRELARLLRRHRPHALLMTGLARGRSVVSFERLGVNCWRPRAAAGWGRKIAPRGPDGLFATAPLEASLAALAAAGAPVDVSESAGTYACNLVLYEALRWRLQGLPGGGPAPELVAFVHLPATGETLPDGSADAILPLTTLIDAVRGLGLLLAGTAPAQQGRQRRSSRPGAGKAQAGRRYT